MKTFFHYVPYQEQILTLLVLSSQLLLLIYHLHRRFLHLHNLIMKLLTFPFYAYNLKYKNLQEELYPDLIILQLIYKITFVMLPLMNLISLLSYNHQYVFSCKYQNFKFFTSILCISCLFYS